MYAPFSNWSGKQGLSRRRVRGEAGFSRRVESGRRGLRRPARRTAMSVRTNRTHPVADRSNLYDEINGKMIAELEAGRFPWVQPWGTFPAKASLCRTTSTSGLARSKQRSSRASRSLRSREDRSPVRVSSSASTRKDHFSSSAAIPADGCFGQCAGAGVGCARRFGAWRSRRCVQQ